jgi:hypothetical protein
MIGIDGGATLVLSNAITGSAALSVSGTGTSGTLVLNTANSYTGGTTLVGTTNIINANANGALGPGPVTFNNEGGYILLANGLNFANTLVANTVNPGVAVGVLMVNDNSNNIVTTVSGPLTFGGSPESGGNFVGPTTSGYLNVTAPITVSSGFLSVRFGNVQFSGGGSYSEIEVRANTTTLGANNGIATNATMDIGGNGSTTVPTYFDMNGFSQTLAGLQNAVTPANVGWVTNSSATTATLTLNLGSGNSDSFGGSIVGNLGLVLNTGSQTLGTNGSPLTGLYNYTGNTFITGGGTLSLGSGINLSNTPVINVDGGATLDASASGLVLGAGQTLTGNGMINGEAVSYGTIAPGTSAVGVLTFEGDLALQPGGVTSIKLDPALGTNDQVVVYGDVTYAGTLSVANLGGSLTNGAHFTLFSASASTAGFASIVGAPPGITYSFTNGVLSVAGSPIPTNPPPLTPTVSGGILTLAWPVAYSGWILQSQTNSLGRGLMTNWVDVAGSSSATNQVITINPANPAVFYRLRNPNP